MNERFTAQKGDGKIKIPQCKKCKYDDEYGNCSLNVRTNKVILNKIECPFYEAVDN